MEIMGVPLGESITLPCSASAVPEPTISWSRTTYYGTEEILESSGNLILDGNDLTVNSVLYFEDDGNYSCIATNSRGISYAVGKVKVYGKYLEFITCCSYIQLFALEFSNLFTC